MFSGGNLDLEDTKRLYQICSPFLKERVEIPDDER